MALSLPTTLRLAQLKALAIQCGISSSGTKSVLATRLSKEITPTAPPHHDGPRTKQATRILSIDMGIRNLAYCVLDIPSSGLSTSSKPSVMAWKRIALSTRPMPSLHLASDGLTTPAPDEKEDFTPPTLATAAHTLLTSTLLPLMPTHILIERQRFRSMGSPRILEWTVRVNMLESMLYAVLHTLKAANLWHGTVQGIAPGKVGPFWTGDGGAAETVRTVRGEDVIRKSIGKVRNTKSAKLRNKGAKIDLVKSWLEHDEVVVFGTIEAQATAKSYLEKWHGQPRGRKKLQQATSEGESIDEKEVMGKLDDLADSLLQGMAWIRWEENKRRVLEHGVDTLKLESGVIDDK